MCGAMFIKSLILFSIDGRGFEDNGTSFKRFHACTPALSAPNPAAGHHRPMPLPETPGRSQESLGQSRSFLGSLLLSPGSWCTQGFICALQGSVSQSCVSSGGSLVRLIATSSKRALCHMQFIS